MLRKVLVALLFVSLAVLALGQLVNTAPVEAANCTTILATLNMRNPYYSSAFTPLPTHGYLRLHDRTTGEWFFRVPDANGWANFGCFPYHHYYDFRSAVDGDAANYTCVGTCNLDNVTFSGTPGSMQFDAYWNGTSILDLSCVWYWTNYPQYEYACTNAWQTTEWGEYWVQTKYGDGIYSIVGFPQTPWSSSVYWLETSFTPPAGHACSAQTSTLSGVVYIQGLHTVYPPTIHWACVP